jgi:hypothetical protein
MCISVLTWLLVECVLAPFIPLRTRETRLDPRDLLKIRPEHLVKDFFASLKKKVKDSGGQVTFEK